MKDPALALAALIMLHPTAKVVAGKAPPGRGLKEVRYDERTDTIELIFFP